MSLLCTADIHLTNNPRDQARWKLLPWITTQVIEKEISQVVIGGDITDSKDHHPAGLVNRLIEQLVELSNHCDVFLIAGNHDFIDPNCPFFKFIESFQKTIYFISTPSSFFLNTGKKSIHCLFLPSTKNWRDDWDGFNFDKYDLIFCHQTFDGSVTENGTRLTGVPPNVFGKTKFWSGDIHVQQKIGKFGEYIGAPYHCRFGDSFTPRVVWLDSNLNPHDLWFPTISKFVLVITSLDELELEAQKLGIKQGDQVKVRVRLPRSQYSSWNQIKSEIKVRTQTYGWELFGPELLPLDIKNPSVQVTAYKSSEEILAEYIKAKKLSQRQAEIGLSLLRD